MNELLTYLVAAEVACYIGKEIVFNKLHKIRPIYKSDKIIKLLPFPLDILCDRYYPKLDEK